MTLDPSQRVRPAGRPLIAVAKRNARRLLATRLYPRPVSDLHPAGLYVYLDALWNRRSMQGAIVEVGCWLGGTAAMAKRLMERAGMENRYVCIDTFGGFVPEHLQHEPSGSKGTTASFASNSPDIVARLLRRWDVSGVELIPGDIAALPDAMLPEQISVALIDVDLKVPVLAALRRIHPRLAPGGIALVDDCADPDWPGAREGYREFVAEIGEAEDYRLGMGVIDR
jgi:predicted O-methyltransferase YrrM